MNLTTSQDKILSYLQQFGRTFLHDQQLADVLALGNATTVTQALKVLEASGLIKISRVFDSRMIVANKEKNENISHSYTRRL